jgi:AraC-like DNA-binding protein
MDEIITFIMILSVAVLLGGFAASGLFSRKLYIPLRELVANVGNLSHEKKNIEENEYLYISHAVENLFSKASEYEKTFNENLKIMRSSFLRSLFNNELFNLNEINDRVKFLRLSFQGPNYRMIKIRLGKPETVSANGDLIAYNILTHAESLGSPGSVKLYGVKNMDLSLTVLCSYRNEGPFLFDEAVNEILRYCLSFFSISAQICISRRTEDILELHHCAVELESIEPYFFFCPDRACLGIQDISALAEQKELPRDISAAFETAIKSQNFSAVSAALENYRKSCGNLEFTSESCFGQGNLMAKYLLSALEKYHAAGGPKEEDIRPESCPNVHEFCARMKDTAARVLEAMADFRKNQTGQMVRKIIEYARENLSKPISLELAAFHLGISRGYAGKIFSAETGESFVEYINNLRLKEAEKLLLNPRLKIENIALKCGFTSAGYFIKRFKKAYGLTPKTYRIQNNIDEKYAE